MKKPSARTAAAREHSVTVIVQDGRWRDDRAVLKLVRRAAGLAHDHPPRRKGAVTILLAGSNDLRRWNRQFRGRDKATNVLSFASRAPGYLGDVAIALGAVKREARAQKKTIAAHAAHLAVHGILHLKGYDHEKEREAAAMERAETLILSRLGLSDPYAPQTYKQPRKALN